MSEPTEQFMQCMEVWGGSDAADRGVVMPGLDVWVYSKPFGGSTEGGDVYYVSSCATGRILRLLVADVSGHGQAVGSVAAGLRGLMRRFVNHLDQTQFVRSMNQQFTALSEAGCFATAVVSTYFGPTGRLSLCNAGHPLPLLYRASNRQWSFLESKHRTSPDPVNLPLGILDVGDYQTFDVPLRVDDLVLCYTDSLIESHGADGRELGHDGLLEIVRSVEVNNPPQFLADLRSAVAAKASGNLTADDVTLLLFRPNSLGVKRPSLGRQLGAVTKLVGAVARRIGGGEPVPWPDLKLANIGGALFSPLQRVWKSHTSS